MKKNKALITILILLLFIAAITFFVKYTANNQIRASYVDGAINMTFRIPNAEEVESSQLIYRIHFLDNYEKVAPMESTLILDHITSEYVLKLDPTWFLGMKDLIELNIEVTYNNGDQREYSTTYTDFLDDLADDFCLTPINDGDYIIYPFENISVKVLKNDIPEDFVLFKSFFSPDERFFIGFKYHAYLYPIKEYQLLSKSAYDNLLDEEKRGTIIPFANESSNTQSVLLNNEYIVHPWEGLFPYDEDGNLIKYVNPRSGGLHLIYNNIISEVYQNSVDKYIDYFANLPKIEFYYND